MSNFISILLAFLLFLSDERETGRQDKHSEANSDIFKNLMGTRRNEFLFELGLKQKMY
jgi:hypothetical protein